MQLVIIMKNNRKEIQLCINIKNSILMVRVLNINEY